MYLIIDIGGTKTLIALFNQYGRVIKKSKFKTPTGRDEFLAVLKSALIPFTSRYAKKPLAPFASRYTKKNYLSPTAKLRLALRQREIQQIIIAIPGQVDQNIAAKFGNRPWRNLDLAQELKYLFNAPITLKNDADLATIYESTFHRGHTLYLTFSTGIGGGIAKRGQLAKNSSSVEPGHTRYEFDGKKQEWEDIASCNAIGAAYDTQATSVRGQKAYSDIATRVSLGLPDLVKKYHPDTIIIGGPLALQFPHIKTELRANLRRALPEVKKIPRITAAKRPKESVIYGGYIFAKKQRR